jgi:branched-chain amino acid transport system substrate-binding protein
MKKLFKGVFVAALLCVLSAAAFAGGQQEAVTGVTDDEITIGTFQAMSGPVASIGVPVANGLEAYFNHVNANGGVYGRQINLIIADDQFNPGKTTVEVKRLVESDGVFAMIAGLGTGGNLAVMDYLNDGGVPFVYQASGSSKLAVPPKEFIFPVQPNYLVEGNVMVRYLAEEKKAKRIAIVYRNAEDGIEEYESVKKAMKLYDAELVEAIAVDPTATDFATEINKLNAAKPDAIIVMLFNPQTPPFVKQAKQYGITEPTYLLSYPNASVTFMALAEEAAENVECMAWVDVDFTDEDFEPFKIYQETQGEGVIPNAFAVAGMVAAELFVEALTIAGPSLSRESLVKALEGFNDWNGQLGKGISYKSYDADDNTCRLGKQSMYVLKVKESVWVRHADWIYYAD